MPKAFARRPSRWWPWLCVACLACVTPRHKSSGPAEVEGPRARDLFPLAVGNRWTYQVGFLGAQQTLALSITGNQGPVFEDSRGQKYIQAAEGVRDQHRYLLKEPLVPGHAWASVIDVTTIEHYQVAAAGVSLDVPAGHFDRCLRIEARSAQASNASSIAEQIYCPRVGLVRVVTYLETNGIRGPPQWKMELASFSMAPPVDAKP